LLLSDGFTSYVTGPVGLPLPAPIEGAYINAVSAAGERAGDDYTRLHSGDPTQWVQPVADSVTVAASITGVYGAGRAAIGCGLPMASGPPTNTSGVRSHEKAM
jgi:hypothetical protein